jgi:hypothetical protein
MRLLIATAAAAAAATAATDAPSQLLVDWRSSPVLGVESRAPLLQWAVPQTQARQAAARVQVVSQPGGALVWDATLPTAWPNTSYAGPALTPTTRYDWRVATTDAGGAVSAWSANASFVTGVWAAPWPAPAAPIWAANASAGFVFLRGVLPLGGVLAAGQLASATLFITANPQASVHGEHENAKLLGAYRAYVNGALVGMGPGRPGRCGPTCPSGSGGGPCVCTPEHVYDTYDVTALVSAGGGPADTATLAVQAFNTPPDSKVLALLVVTAANGTVVTAGTTATGGAAAWKAWVADGYMNASCCTAQQWYIQARENYDTAAEPVGWRLPGYDDSAWGAAAEAAPIAAPLVARPTRPMAVATGVVPAVVTRLAPGHVFIDMGREVQGGLTAVFTNASGGELVYARFGEALLSADPPAVQYEMSTGNSYWMGWTLRATSPAAPAVTVETHEYLEWRYAELVAAAPPAAPTPQCAVSAVADYTTPVSLTCADPAATVTAITFASWGTPTGACEPPSPSLPPGANTFAVNGTCAYARTAEVVAGLCVGKAGGCSFVPSDALFGGVDPCERTPKRLAVAVACNNSAVPPPPPPAAGDPGWLVNVTAWVLTYPADYAGDGDDTATATTATDGGGEAAAAAAAAQRHQRHQPHLRQQAAVTVSDPALQAVIDLCHYTVVATGLDLYTDSNTRQRSPMCSEALMVTMLTQWAVSAEWALPRYTLEYVLNQGGAGGMGWAEWQAFSIFAVHMHWVATGTLDVFADHYAQLRGFTELGLVDNATGLWTCPGGASPPFSCGHPEIDWPTGMRDGFVFMPANAVVGSYTARAMTRFAEMAAALGGHDADVALFNASGAALAAAVHARLYNASAGAYVDGLGTTHSAWHSSVYALAMGIPPPADAPAVWATVVRRSAGDPSLCNPGNVFPTLWALTAFYANTSDYGWTGHAYLTCNGTNSWLAMVAQGATTTMEAWHPDEKPNLTWSHPWAATPAWAVPRLLFGVEPMEPGFRRLRLRPQPGPLAAGNATVPTLAGPVTLAFTQAFRPAAQPFWPSSITVTFATPGGVGTQLCLPYYPCASDTGAWINIDGQLVVAAVVDGGDWACTVADLPPGPHVASCEVA